ncbi:hypothetical protein [Sphingorhabdus sp. Alg239-R122]|uniref:hypothetical protein n=1 Tax=Sphingorhabdus sp. Alg239-R122 TaxID=2305989 RepID=UPI0013DB1520|nr:hypothetical protein [Sphingorhabdus sp. Alg239-R122]
MARSSYRYTTTKLDILFAFLAPVSIFLFADGPPKNAEIPPVFGQYVMAAIGIGATLLFSLIATKAADLDRRCAEEYAFQMLANAAVIAVITTMFTHVIWDMSVLNDMGLPKPSSGQIIGVLVLSWAAGYAIYRIRGIKS